MNNFISDSPEKTISIGKEIASRFEKGSVIALRGSLGAGKTTLVKGIAMGLGIKEAITSPTYTIISEYEGSEKNLYHMDLYRIDTLEEFELLGADELIYGQDVTVIEWSEKISEYLPDNTITITITIKEDKTRNIKIEGIK